MFQKYFPILEWLPNYKREYLSGDLIAGVTVGIMLIPQGMAYALIAGLPPVYGLYAALIPQVIYAFMGTSRQLAVGPVAMDSLLVATGLGALAISGIDEYISMAIFLALFIGLIQLLLGVLKMGFLVNFLSQPVISGFTSAAAIIISFSQLRNLLGIDVERSSRLHSILINAWKSLENIHFYTLAVGLVSILILWILKRINKRIPGPLVIVVLSLALAYWLNFESLGVQVIQTVPEGLPDFAIPNIDLSRIKDLIPIAITLALVAFMEAISIAKSVESHHKEYELDPNQELIALGSSNVVGSFFQSYPICGGFSRTAVNNQMGAKTGIAALVSAILVGFTLMFLTPVFYFLPKTVLAAIIIVAVFGLLDVKYPLRLFKTRKDEFFLLIFTFLLTLFVGITEGILLGVLMSLLLVVSRTSRPHMAVLGKIKGTQYFKNIQRFEGSVEKDDRILVIRFDSELYFGNKDYFKKEIFRFIDSQRQKPETLIIKAEPINYIDSSAMFMLEKLIDDLKKNNIRVLFSDVIGPTRDILQNSTLFEKIGKENFFVRASEAYDYALNQTPKNPIQEQVALQSKSQK